MIRFASLSTRLGFSTFVLLALFLLGVQNPCRATILATCLGPEKDSLLRLFDNAKQKIDVQCVAIEEPTIVQALKRASERGVSVRVVVDTISPSLLEAVRTGNSNLEVRILSRQYHGRFLAPSANEFRTESKDRLSPNERKWANKRTLRYLRGNAL